MQKTHSNAIVKAGAWSATNAFKCNRKGQRREATHAPKASLHLGGLLMSTAVLRALPARYLEQSHVMLHDATHHIAA